MGYAFIIEPDTYHAFATEAEQIDQCKEWSLLSDKATKTKTFIYKGHGSTINCSVVGYVDRVTAVLAFDNNELHCIHPSYLKEMQAANYSQRLVEPSEQLEAEDLTAAQAIDLAIDAPGEETAVEAAALAAQHATAEPDLEQAESAEPISAAAEPTTKSKAKKEQKPKVQLPEDKVKMTAIVQEITTVPNHFSDTDDDVVIYEAVFITEPEIEVGSAWSSYSATLKKLELAVGDKLTFEGKIVTKKLTKHPVPYKINNPGKMQKV